MHTQHILLIEDDPTEATLAKHHFKKIAPELIVTHFSDGQAFLNFCRTEPTEDVCLAIMDLHMAGTGGIATLRQISEQDQRLPFPILILSSSTDPGEIREAYQLGASAFVTKPVDHQKYREAVGHIANFWLSTNRIG